ncbi:ATP-binding protein [Clostridium thermarum]|uniref:ATP-binding protein n=1 Tax=Clostridium thermarum TaxID=1716543 RepID=UPI0013D758D4|nr:AAA family ATPase [Clostridium thermarum]
MKIKSLYVKSFGKLKDFNLELNPGLNIIYGSNEAGKTTLQHFIKAMFYGMNSQKKSIRENDRRRFLPWDTGRAEGKLAYIDDGGNEYVIERSFGQTRREDQSTVYKAMTGQKAVHIDNYQPGRDLFAMSEDAFEKTVFIKQLGAKMAMDKEDEIMKKLSNLQQSGEEDLSYHKAKTALDNYKKSLRGQRKNGKIDELEENINHLKQQLLNLQQLHAENLEDSELLNSLSLKVRTLEEAINSYQSIKPDIDISILRDRLYELRPLEAQITTLSNRLGDLRKKFKHYECFESLGEDIELKLNSMAMKKKEKEEKLAFIADIKSEIKALQDRARYLKNHSGDIEKLLEITSEEENSFLQLEERIKEIDFEVEKAKLRDNRNLKADILKDKKNNSTFIMLAGTLLTMVFIWGAVAKSLWAMTLGLMGALMAVYGFLQFKRASDKLRQFAANEKLGDNIAGLSKEKYELEEYLKELYQQYGVQSYSELRSKLDVCKSTITTLEGINMRISDKQEELYRLNEQEVLEYLNKIRKYYDFLFNHCSCATIEEFSERLNTYRALKASITSLQEEYDKCEAELSNKVLELLYKELNSCKEHKKDVEHRIDMRFKDKPSLVSIEEELLQSNVDKEKYEELYQCADIASEVLGEAFEEIQKNFIPRLNAEVGGIVNKLTAGKYSEVRIAAGENYEINVLEQHNLRDLDYLSGGTFDQVYFALRIGICNIIFKDKPIPIFLDDAFIQYDEERLARALEFLKEYSKDYQVIVFTCRRLPIEYTINLNEIVL